MSFLTDLEHGEKAEDTFGEILEALGLGWEKNEGKTLAEKRRWDGRDTKYGFSYEIKSDRGFPRTGNIYLEHKGITRSEADYLVYHFGGQYYKIGMVQAKALLDSPRYKRVVGGDDKNTGTLIPGEEFAWLGSLVAPPKRYVKKRVSNPGLTSIM